jgi:hypothetical protein
MSTKSQAHASHARVMRLLSLRLAHIFFLFRFLFLCFCVFICSINFYFVLFICVAPVVLISTLVHELIHYHMFVVGKFRPNPPNVEEGVCELAAAQILKSTLHGAFSIVHTRVMTFQNLYQLLYLRSLPPGDDRDMRIRQVLKLSNSQLLAPIFSYIHSYIQLLAPIFSYIHSYIQRVFHPVASLNSSLSPGHACSTAPGESFISLRRWAPHGRAEVAAARGRPPGVQARIRACSRAPVFWSVG